MAHLIYSAISSLDGYIEDTEANFIGQCQMRKCTGSSTTSNVRPTLISDGRRMYETMMVWETDPNLAADFPLTQDFAEIWAGSGKTKSCTPRH